jgi:hypothetical protein
MEQITRADAGVGVVCTLFAIPLSEASWHAIVVEHETVAGLIGLCFGVPIGVAGLTFHWWKDSPLRQKVQWQVFYWWPVGAVLAFVYVAGPNIYNRIQSKATADHIERVVKPIRAELVRTTRERDDARAALSAQAPAPPPSAKFVVDASFLSTPEMPLAFSGTANITAARLHVFGKIARGMGSKFGPAVELPQIINPVRGERLKTIQLIFKNRPPDTTYYFAEAGAGGLWVMNTIALEIYPPGSSDIQTICSVVIHTSAAKNDPVIVYAPGDTTSWVAASRDCRQ